MKATTLVLAAALVSTTVLFAQTPIRPGRWEVTMQMQMPNMPMQMPEMKTTQCVTPEQVKDPAGALPGAPPGGRGGSDCKVSGYKVSGNKVAWQMACTTPQAMTGSGELTFTDDSYTGTMKMNAPPQGDMTMKMAGKRLGDCTP